MFNFLNRIYFIITGSYIKPFGVFYTNHCYKFFDEYRSEKGDLTTLKYIKIFYNLKYKDIILDVTKEDGFLKVLIHKYNISGFGGYRTKQIMKIPYSDEFLNNNDIIYTASNSLLTIYLFSEISNFSDKTVKELLTKGTEL